MSVPATAASSSNSGRTAEYPLNQQWVKDPSVYQIPAAIVALLDKARTMAKPQGSVTYPWQWPVSQPPPPWTDVQNAMVEVANEGTLLEQNVRRWPEEWGIDLSKKKLLDLGVQRLLLGYVDDARYILLHTWRRVAARRFQGSPDVGEHQSARMTYCKDSLTLNQGLDAYGSIEAAATSKDALGAIVRMFVGPQPVGISLPVGSVLWEGARQSAKNDLALDAACDGKPFSRRRCTSTTWSFLVAMRFGLSESYEKVVQASYNSWSQQHSLPSIFYLHEIVSPYVRAVDASELCRDEREVILQPFLHFHVVSDRATLVQIGHPEAYRGPHLIRLMHTHVFTEPVCPRCATRA